MNMNDKRSLEHTPKAQLGLDRLHTARTAQQLSVVALRQAERAVAGAFALPAAGALGAAATVLFALAFVERGVEVFESAISEIGRHLRHDDVRGAESWNGEAERVAEARA